MTNSGRMKSVNFYTKTLPMHNDIASTGFKYTHGSNLLKCCNINFTAFLVILIWLRSYFNIHNMKVVLKSIWIFFFYSSDCDSTLHSFLYYILGVLLIFLESFYNFASLSIWFYWILRIWKFIDIYETTHQVDVKKKRYMDTRVLGRLMSNDKYYVSPYAKGCVSEATFAKKRVLLLK